MLNELGKISLIKFNLNFLPIKQFKSGIYGIFQNFDAQALPFEDYSFDGIFLYDALQHIQDRKLALNECLRVLNEDGVIVVIEWSEGQIEKEYKKYGYKIDFIDPQDYIIREDISFKVFKGETINFYLIRKN